MSKSSSKTLKFLGPGSVLVRSGLPGLERTRSSRPPRLAHALRTGTVRARFRLRPVLYLPNRRFSTRSVVHCVVLFLDSPRDSKANPGETNDFLGQRTPLFPA